MRPYAHDPVIPQNAVVLGAILFFFTQYLRHGRDLHVFLSAPDWDRLVTNWLEDRHHWGDNLGAALASLRARLKETVEHNMKRRERRGAAGGVNTTAVESFWNDMDAEAARKRIDVRSCENECFVDGEHLLESCSVCFGYVHEISAITRRMAKAFYKPIGVEHTLPEIPINVGYSSERPDLQLFTYEVSTKRLAVTCTFPGKAPRLSKELKSLALQLFHEYTSHAYPMLYAPHSDEESVGSPRRMFYDGWMRQAQHEAFGELSATLGLEPWLSEALDDGAAWAHAHAPETSVAFDGLTLSRSVYRCIRAHAKLFAPSMPLTVAHSLTASMALWDASGYAQHRLMSRIHTLLKDGEGDQVMDALAQSLDVRGDTRTVNLDLMRDRLSPH